MSTKQFSTAAIASLSSGVLLCPFHDMQEAAEFLMGHPIWTHHFADKELRQRMRDAVVRQHPGMPLKIDGVTRDNYLEKLAKLEDVFGKTLEITSGDGATAKHPLEGIPSHVDVIGVVVP